MVPLRIWVTLLDNSLLQWLYAGSLIDSMSQVILLLPSYECNYNAEKRETNNKPYHKRNHIDFYLEYVTILVLYLMLYDCLLYLSLYYFCSWYPILNRVTRLTSILQTVFVFITFWEMVEWFNDSTACTHFREHILKVKYIFVTLSVPLVSSSLVWS